MLLVISQNINADNATNPNLVYIEQVGNTNTITIEQVGGTNNVGGSNGNISVSNSDNITTLTPDAPSSLNYGSINGSSNTATITQHGTNNWAQYNIKGGNNQYTSAVSGNDNMSKLLLGDANTNNLRNIISETITGNTNLILQTLLGSDITSTIVTTGNSNQITNNLKSANGKSNIAIAGNTNILIDEQLDSAGAFGHDLKQYIAGDYNSNIVQQQGTNDTTVDIRTTGDHNTVTVRTSSSAIVNPQTAIAR
jgi:hypothetical protein